MTDAEEALERRIEAARQWMNEAFEQGDKTAAREWCETMRDLISERSEKFVRAMEKRLGLR